MLIKYIITWFGIMILAVINGAIREALYKSYTGELAAHQISTVILLILITFYLWVLLSYWPLKSSPQAWSIGFIWLLMTLSFEFGVGRFVAGNPWSKLFHDYNLLAGRVWIFIPLWVLSAPYVLSRMRLKRPPSA